MRIISPGYPLSRETLVESLALLRANRNAALHFADQLVALLASFSPTRESVFRKCAEAAFAWYAVNVDASIESCELTLAELPAPGVERVIPRGATAESYLASLVGRRDLLQEQIESLENAVTHVEAPGLDKYLEAMSIDPLRRELAAVESEISVLQARMESAPAADAAAIAESPVPGPHVPGPALYPFGSGGGGLYGGTLPAMSKSNVGDTPVDHEKQEVPITYRKAQAVQSLCNSQGYNTPGNRDGIMLNARNSGTPSTAAEAAQWQKDRPGSPYIPPISPATFQPIPAQVVSSHDSDTYNYNFDSRVLLLVLSTSGPNPGSAVMTADAFTDDKGELVSEAAAKAILEAQTFERQP